MKYATCSDYVGGVSQALSLLPCPTVEQIAGVLSKVRLQGRRIFVFGNGGSSASASHFVNDMVKSAACRKTPRFKVHCLSDNTPTLTAYGNDVAYDAVYSEQLLALAEAGDMALAISGSGNSPNIIRAMDAARELGLSRVGLTGRSGGKLKERCDLCVCVPSDSMQILEDAHMVILHAIFVMLQD